MTLSHTKPLILSKADVLGVPAWVGHALGVGPAQIDTCREPGVSLVSPDGSWSLARAVVEDADDLDHVALRRATARAYRGVLQELTGTTAPHPVRAWNAVPSITRSDAPGLHRYMAFNAGRHDAYAGHFASTNDMPRAMPTASAVGHDAQDLAICVLGYRQPGLGIENPRQVPAFRYSSRYGTTPPSFVRATVLPPEDANAAELRVLVAGTASVVGEDSQHTGDLQKQLEETYRNMATLVAAASGLQRTQSFANAEQQAWLDRYRSARVYIRRPDDFKPVMGSVSSALPDVNGIEFVRADICRPELLVEIEGVASIPSPGVLP